MRQICDPKKQIILLLVGSGCLRIEAGNLFADFSHALLQIVCWFAARFLAANLFTQSFAIGVELLQRRFCFPALDVHAQDVVDLGFVSPTPRGKALANKIRFLSNQTNVEHGAV
jgi:hypothetical protein